jgi:hypothetical protein
MSVSAAIHNRPARSLRGGRHSNRLTEVVNGIPKKIGAAQPSELLCDADDPQCVLLVSLPLTVLTASPFPLIPQTDAETVPVGMTTGAKLTNA